MLDRLIRLVIKGKRKRVPTGIYGLRTITNLG